MDADQVRTIGVLVPISEELLAQARQQSLLWDAFRRQHPPARPQPRPVMQAALLFTALRRCAAADTPLALEVLELHRPPADLDAWAECQGCGAGGYDDGVTWEACPTVELLAARYQLALP